MASFIYQDTLYTLVDGPSWDTARANAISAGGDLAVVDSAELTELIVSELSLSGPGAWIGLRKNETKTAFEWITGEPLIYSNWVPGEPNNANGVEDYVQVYGADATKWTGNWIGSWNDNAGDPLNYWGDSWYLPMKGIAAIPMNANSQDSFVKNPENGHYYQAISDNVTWEVALSQANQASYRGLQGYLATITSAEEDRFVHYEVVNKSSITGWGSFAGYQGTWLGGSDRDQEGIWKWMNGPEEGQIFATSSGARNITSAGGNYSNFLPSVHEGSSRTDFDYLVTQVPRTSTSVPSGWTNSLFWDDIPTNIGSAAVREYGAYDYGVGNGYVIEYGGLPPTYRVVASNNSINEGGSITFEVFTTNVEWGSSLRYSISGISSNDLSSGSLSGQMVVQESGKDGKASIMLSIAADQLTEGAEVLAFTIEGQSASVTINDTSLTPQPTYALSASAGTVQEGTSAQFLLATTNVAAGTSVAYTVSGVSSADVVGGVMSGTATVGTNGQATISVPLAADNLTEGSETLTVTAQGKSASVTVEDTSRAQFSNVTGVAASTASVDEGSVATFTVTSTNVDAGKQYSYTITGIDAVDLLTEELSGFVTIGATGTGTIQLSITPDAITEGPETLTLTVEGKSGSIGINDTSKGTSSYTVTGLTSTVNEGEIANFTVQASNTAAGSAIPYKITGVAAADFANKSLEGIVVINSAGVGKIALQIEADNALEGDEVFTIVVGDASGSMRIVDTSNPGKPFEQTNTVANETFVAPAGTTRFEIAARSDEVSVRSTDGGKTWVVTSKDTGADTLTGYKRIKLEDSTIALDFSPGETSYKSVMLIGAAFGKDFVPGYFGAGVSLFDSGSSMQDIAKLIADIGLIEQVIGDNSESAWVKHVYKNVVGAEPDLLTEAVFVNWLTTGAYSRGDLLALAADLPLLESQVDMTGYQTNGMTYSAFI